MEITASKVEHQVTAARMQIQAIVPAAQTAQAAQAAARVRARMATREMITQVPV